MQAISVTVTQEFKNAAYKAVRSILLFVFVYILLLIFALALVGLAALGGLKLIATRPGGLTFMLGLGLVGMGVMILVFLVKFLFKRHKIDRSHLIEITEHDEPKLFQYIREIVDQVQTQFPKKVYLSPEVNASVFYDSSFWSMFLPIRKNLNIGIGLVNSVTAAELKAILAHEFGHFSQRSMKVGSYVYYVNQVIYNMLYDNDSFSEGVEKWASFSGYFSLFVIPGAKIIELIQLILNKVYQKVNINYNRLSKEMEFHADEIAAQVSGSKPLASSLLRLDLAQSAYNSVLEYYNLNYAEAKVSRDIYPQQKYVMNFLSEKFDILVKDGLPQVDTIHLSRFNKSKLVVEDQWASHPRTEDRISRLESLNLPDQKQEESSAGKLFHDYEQSRLQVTEHLFTQVQYELEKQEVSLAQFQEAFLKNYEEQSFHEIYLGYYDSRNPVPLSVDELAQSEVQVPAGIEVIFNPEILDVVNVSLALEADINMLKHIELNSENYPSFEYEGNKYSPQYSDMLVPKLEKELEELQNKLKLHDELIFSYFLSLARQQGKEQTYLSHYQSFLDIDQEYAKKLEPYQALAEASFIFQGGIKMNQLQAHLDTLGQHEVAFKDSIKTLLEDERYKEVMHESVVNLFAHYLSGTWDYFIEDEWYESNINMLMSTMQVYTESLNAVYFQTKKKFLAFQASLEPSTISQSST